MPYKRLKSIQLNNRLAAASAMGNSVPVEAYSGRFRRLATITKRNAAATMAHTSRMLELSIFLSPLNPDENLNCVVLKVPFCSVNRHNPAETLGHQREFIIGRSS